MTNMTLGPTLRPSIGPAISDRVPSPGENEPQIAQMTQIARAGVQVIPV